MKGIVIFRHIRMPFIMNEIRAMQIGFIHAQN